MRISSTEAAAGRDIVDRVTAILECVAGEPQGIRLADLVERTDMKKTTVLRIAERLVAHRVLQRTDGGYQLGLNLFEWSQAVPVTHVLRAAALPVMAEMRSLGAAVELAVADGHEVVLVERLYSDEELTTSNRRRPAHCTALGQVITAFSSPSILERVLLAGLTPETPHTITEPALLRTQISKVHAEGLAVEVQTYRLGQISIAAPIVALAYRGIDDYPACAGLAVTGRFGRIAASRLTTPVTAAARAISARLSLMSRAGTQDWPRPVVGRPDQRPRES